MSRTSRKLLSQNFLWNRELVSKLIRGSSVSPKDQVLEIGPGKGIITEQLLTVCGKLIAIEADVKLHDLLRKKFVGKSRLSLLSGDFLKQPLPDSEFKVFSNIPFSVTGEIIKKLLFSQNPPTDSYLVVQREAADKFIASRHRNTMLAILFYPWFNIEVVHEFERTDFKPVPRINSCLIRLEKRSPPLLGESLQWLYRDFVVFYFTRDKKAVSLSPSLWLNRFETFLEHDASRLLKKLKGSFAKWRAEEMKLSKIHRSRTNEDWRRF